MRVLVTGHLGYIGTVMVPMLLKAGHELAGLDSISMKAAPSLPAATSPTCRISIRITRVPGARLGRVEAVIHLAALSNDPLGNLNPEITFNINHRASVRLARLAKEAGVRRFLLASSCSNYGMAGEALVDETSALNPSRLMAIQRSEPSGTSFRSRR